MFKVPEQYRVGTGRMASDESFGNNGMFRIPLFDNEVGLVIASDGAGWEHVSMSLHDRMPTWEEMCLLKSIFWGKEDTVVQFHPPQSEYVNMHDFCLHLWRPIGVDFPVPNSILVGIK